jgi:transcriptional regulator GlxA family with amidase domain
MSVEGYREREEPHMSETRKRNVGILLFERAELLDFAGPYEAFSSATIDGEKCFNTFTVGQQKGVITSNNGLPCGVEYSFEDAPDIDVLVVPGGQGTRTEIDNPVVIDWIKDVAGKAELMTSVCTGSFLLAKAGLLSGNKATTHWGSIQRLREAFPDTEVLEQVRFVDDGFVVSSAGVSAGIDMSLHVIERLCGVDAARSSARLMEYDYWPDPALATTAG